jgi:hypothetical protein
MSAPQPPRNKQTHYLVAFTLFFLTIIILSVVYVEDVQEGAKIIVDRVVRWVLDGETNI